MTDEPVKLKENDLIQMFLSDESIANVLLKGCNPVRNSCSCPNSKLCKDLFTENGNLIIRREREKFWTPGQTVKPTLLCHLLCANISLS